MLKTNLKTARTMYLYPEGHAIIVHKKYDKNAGEVQWAVLHSPEQVGIDCDFTGRLIIDDNAIATVRTMAKIVCTEPSIDNGSESTKNKGIRVASVTLKTKYDLKDYYSGLRVTLFPDILSGDFTYQPEFRCESDGEYNKVKDMYSFGYNINLNHAA